MKFEVRNEANYAAKIIAAPEPRRLDGLDNLVALDVDGYQALVSKDITAGTRLVMFPAESQLSESFARARNLYSAPERNADPEAKGYLANNRRVRAIRLRGNISSALVLKVPAEWGDVPVGTLLDTVDGVEVSRKFVAPVKQAGSIPGTTPKWRRVDRAFLPEHIDTLNYWRYVDQVFEPSDYVVVTQKTHGTSVRIGRVPVKVKPSWRTRLAKWMGLPVKEFESDIIGGSRKVIKDPAVTGQNHFYSRDVWTEAARKYGDRVPENVILYGELVGWVGGTPIQPNYTYDVPRGEMELYVYRVAVVTPAGELYDLPWGGVEQFCDERGFRYVPVLWRGLHADFNVDDWIDRRFYPQFLNAVPLSDPDTVDEGVVVRGDGLTPRVLKAKSPIFLTHETKMLDAEKEALS